MRFWTYLLCGIGLLAALSAAVGTVFTASADGFSPDPALAAGIAHRGPVTENPLQTALLGPGPEEPLLSPSRQSRLLLRLRVGTFDPRDRVPSIPQGLRRHGTGSAAALYLIQFPGPIQDTWIQAILHAGLEIVTYMPDYAYLIWGTPSAVRDLIGSAPIRWYGAYEPAYVIHPDLLTKLGSSEPLTVTVQFFEHDGAGIARQIIEQKATQVLRPAHTVGKLTNLVVTIEGTALFPLAHLPEMISIEPAITPRLLDEVQGQLVAGNLTLDGSRPSGTGYLNWLTATVGLTTTASAYPIVDITDDGIDNGDATPQHPDFYAAGDIAQPDRLVYNANWTTDPTADGGGGHGNLNASIVGGYNALTGFPYEDANGYNYGLGINPFGPIAGSKIFGNASGWAYPDYVDLVTASYNGGARIISNSWGDTPGAGGYLIDDQIYDALVRDADPTTAGEQPVTIVFAAGNSGSSPNTIGSPANAKNIITVGAAESYRPTWTDGCGISAAAANNANDIASFSSRGPTDDGRVKPELVAPGTHVQGAAAQTVNYTGFYICDAFYPPGQTLYGASSGTSHATPAVSGAASLLTHFYESRLSEAPPSPAMVKAYLVNAARYLDGVSSGDTLPSNAQGFGVVDLGNAFDTTPRLLWDQEQILHTTGESVVVRGAVAQSSAPFRVTLGWTDAPGPTTGAAYVNDLDLVVAVNGQTYLGNVFSGAHSVAGGSPDFRNNIESIFLPAGIQGAFTITVTATNLAGDGVPDEADPTDQDFALVCYNCTAAPVVTLAVTPATLRLCRPATGVYTITPSAPPGVTGPITLTAGGMPTGTLSRLAPNPITVAEQSHLEITATMGTPTGRYTLQITGTSETAQPTATATLDILTTPEAPARLLSPGDAVLDVPITPLLSWDPQPGADLYTVEIATDVAFADPVYAITTTATTHTVTPPLHHAKTYFWRVHSANMCGSGPPSAAQTFTTVPFRVYCPIFHVAPAPDSQPPL
ncbi:MAG: S8 family serine peptidase [Anaerolineae bacterium]|nr:S8 family serine peptidase [Anaerolineae bacterium]